MNIWIEAKTPANQNAGITKWFNQIIEYLNQEFPDQLTLIYPKKSAFVPFPNLKIRRKQISLPIFLPKKLSKILYDLFIFRMYAQLKKPDLILSPYFDVIMPKNFNSIISIHDLCFAEVPECYGFFRRNYFLSVMKFNSRKSAKFLTVSNYSKSKISNYLNISSNSIFIFPNFLDADFLSYAPSSNEIEEFQSNYKNYRHTILYSGGLENRKNIPLLAQTIELLNADGFKIALIITGHTNKYWREIIDKSVCEDSFIDYIGELTAAQLKTAYLSVNGVVYPSLSEGFGRPCLEAMVLAVPLACSNLDVFHEIVGEYPIYFDPQDVDSFKHGITLMLERDLNGFKYDTQISTFSDGNARDLIAFISG